MPVIITLLLLVHGGMFEEAQESCNKYIKRFREDYARKYSRIKTMEDVSFGLLVASDPYISSLRRLPQQSKRSLSPVAYCSIQMQRFLRRVKKNQQITTPNSPMTHPTDFISNLHFIILFISCSVKNTLCECK
ncbi:hypothetical protein RI129_008845 [Pyrocoelia pectoralis]|uniref:Uncharacterized protein n=1 Tax=Pyrocoelia pectoralis TaxID=417401 RepID=A0AAN7VC63_9COLE